ncbi:hypothetical protein PG990_000004 [Apiospora arundinis]
MGDAVGVLGELVYHTQLASHVRLLSALEQRAAEQLSHEDPLAADWVIGLGAEVLAWNRPQSFVGVSILHEALGLRGGGPSAAITTSRTRTRVIGIPTTRTSSADSNTTSFANSMGNKSNTVPSATSTTRIDPTTRTSMIGTITSTTRTTTAAAAGAPSPPVTTAQLASEAARPPRGRAPRPELASGARFGVFCARAHFGQFQPAERIFRRAALKEVRMYFGLDVGSREQAFGLSHESDEAGMATGNKTA